MTRYRRIQIGLRPVSGLTRLDPNDVEGIVLHWPALSKPIRGIEKVKAALRGWQDYHQETQGWADIAYQEAIDQDGNSYVLRGLRYRSAANGDRDLNETLGSLLLIVAPGEALTPALLDTTRRRIARHRVLYPRSTRIVGHSAVRPEPTACPGPIVTKAIAEGRFTPTRKASR